jgi:murein DD-endopeptidase MepM/ murein hydrolase activator NlpD
MKLLLPISGADPESIKGHFYQARGERVHHAADILTARNTPILAVDDGRIARLFRSALGGITVYQFDPNSRYVFYYAHLERYAAGLKAGDVVRKGQVIGFVGTSGNAPPTCPHLHFSINRLDDEKRWWTGTPIDPYEVFRSTGDDVAFEVRDAGLNG